MTWITGIRRLAVVCAVVVAILGTTIVANAGESESRVGMSFATLVAIAATWGVFEIFIWVVRGFIGDGKNAESRVTVNADSLPTSSLDGAGMRHFLKSYPWLLALLVGVSAIGIIPSILLNVVLGFVLGACGYLWITKVPLMGYISMIAGMLTVYPAVWFFVYKKGILQRIIREMDAVGGAK